MEGPSLASFHLAEQRGSWCYGHGLAHGFERIYFFQLCLQVT